MRRRDEVSPALRMFSECSTYLPQNAAKGSLGVRLLLAFLVDRHAGRLGLVQPLQLADESHRVQPMPQLADAWRVLQLQRARRATAGTSVELQRGSVHGWPVRLRGGVRRPGRERSVRALRQARLPAHRYREQGHERACFGTSTREKITARYEQLSPVLAGDVPPHHLHDPVADPAVPAETTFERYSVTSSEACRVPG